MLGREGTRSVRVGSWTWVGSRASPPAASKWRVQGVQRARHTIARPAVRAAWCMGARKAARGESLCAGEQEAADAARGCEHREPPRTRHQGTQCRWPTDAHAASRRHRDTAEMSGGMGGAWTPVDEAGVTSLWGSVRLAPVPVRWRPYARRGQIRYACLETATGVSGDGRRVWLRWCRALGGGRRRAKASRIEDMGMKGQRMGKPGAQTCAFLPLVAALWSTYP
jgi:hypothetical protein